MDQATNCLSSYATTRSQAEDTEPYACMMATRGSFSQSQALAFERNRSLHTIKLIVSRTQSERVKRSFPIPYFSISTIYDLVLRLHLAFQSCTKAGCDLGTRLMLTGISNTFPELQCVCVCVCDVGMPVAVCYHPYHPCLNIFWQYYPYFLLQFSAIVFYTCCTCR